MPLRRNPESGKQPARNTGSNQSADRKDGTHVKTLLIVALMVGLLAGCEPPAPVMPKVSDINCQLPNIMEIKDKATREAFAGACSRRSPTDGGIAPTEKPKNWLELIDQPLAPKGQEAKL